MLSAQAHPDGASVSGTNRSTAKKKNRHSLSASRQLNRTKQIVILDERRMFRLSYRFGQKNLARKNS